MADKNFEELGYLRARMEMLAEALAECDRVIGSMHGCSDRLCSLTGHRSGMVTNGGCRCVKDFEARKALVALHSFRKQAQGLITTTKTT